MKVYVITSGEYSDYHIDGVTLDKELAENLVKSRNENLGKYDDEYYLEVYDTDDFPLVRDGHAPYYVEFFKYKSGDLGDWCTKCRRGYASVNEVIEPGEDDSATYAVVVFAKDEDGAVKIASEKVAEYRAHKEGIS